MNPTPAWSLVGTEPRDRLAPARTASDAIVADGRTESSGQRCVLSMGTFDLFHIGHLRLLERAARFGALAVGVNSDDFVLQYKRHRPVVCEDDRLRIVASLRCVRRAYLHCDPHALIERLRPDALVVGSDWHEHDYLGQIGTTQSHLDDLGVAVIYVPRTRGVSTTELRRRLSDARS